MVAAEKKLLLARKSYIFVSGPQKLKRVALISRRPGLLNSIIGLITTGVNANGRLSSWSTSAIIAIIITGTCTVILSVLSLVYKVLCIKSQKEYDNA
jgi:hypothetical protein